MLRTRPTARRLLMILVTGVVMIPVGAGVATALPVLPPLPAPLGDDAFYTPPSPLPEGEPGDLISSRPVLDPTYPNARVEQIMYLSTNNQDDAVAVTGALLTPLNQAPGGDNRLVVHTPGTRGLGDQCAPSKETSFSQTSLDAPLLPLGALEIQQFLVRGISVVITDYEGSGTPGLPSYLVGRPEGYAALDALRAAQRVAGSGVSERSPVGIAGYSQGGQAAAWAGELQPEYAPELDLRGVMAGGVPADMNVEVDHLNGNPTGGPGFALAALVGLDVANPELDLDSRLTTAGRAIMERVETGCSVDYLTAYGVTSSADVTQPDVLADPEWRARFAESLLGTSEPGAPAFLYHATIDTIVPYAQGVQLYQDWCGQGASVTFLSAPAEHVSGLGPSPVGVDWLTDRLDGVPAPAGCRQLGL